MADTACDCRRMNGKQACEESRGGMHSALHRFPPIGRHRERMAARAASGGQRPRRRRCRRRTGAAHTSALAPCLRCIIRRPQLHFAGVPAQPAAHALEGRGLVLVHHPHLQRRQAPPQRTLAGARRPPQAPCQGRAQRQKRCRARPSHGGGAPAANSPQCPPPATRPASGCALCWKAGCTGWQTGQAPRPGSTLTSPSTPRVQARA